MPFFRVFAVAQTALLAHRHLRRLDATERRRLYRLVRRGPGMDRSERAELRQLVGKLEPRAFAVAAANSFSPVRVPRRFGR